jgi:hypothetical protein
MAASAGPERAASAKAAAATASVAAAVIDRAVDAAEIDHKQLTVFSFKFSAKAGNYKL